MHIHKAAMCALILLCGVATACTLPSTTPTPTAVKLTKATRTALAATALAAIPASPSPLVPLATGAPAFPTVAGGDPVAPASTVVVATDVSAATYCADPQVTTLINNFKTALQTSNGTQLASLVSPTHGMSARLYRDGTVIIYDQRHAKFLFESTFSVDWGPAPGSGQHTAGSFHETIVPDLRDVFGREYTLACNQIQVGGTTYQAAWPYPGINFYSAYYPGTQANGNMDWRTWLLGMHYVNGKPYLYSIMQFKWEP